MCTSLVRTVVHQDPKPAIQRHNPKSRFKPINLSSSSLHRDWRFKLVVRPSTIKHARNTPRVLSLCRILESAMGKGQPRVSVLSRVLRPLKPLSKRLRNYVSGTVLHPKSALDARPLHIQAHSAPKQRLRRGSALRSRKSNLTADPTVIPGQ